MKKASCAASAVTQIHMMRRELHHIAALLKLEFKRMTVSSAHAYARMAMSVEAVPIAANDHV